MKDKASFRSAFAISLVGILLAATVTGVVLVPIAFAHSNVVQHLASTNLATAYKNSSIHTNNMPTGIAVNNQNGLIYIGDGHQLDVVNGSLNNITNISTTIKLPSLFYKGIDDVAVNPSSNMIYVSVPDQFIGVSLMAINGSTGQIAKSLGFWGGTPIGADLSVNPVTNTIYAAVPSLGAGVTVINGSSYKYSNIQLNDPNCGGGCAFVPEGVAVNPDVNLVYAVGENFLCGSSNSSNCYNDLFVINGTTNSIVQRVNITGSSTAYLAGYDSYTNDVFVSTDNALDVFDGSNGSLITQIQISGLNFAFPRVGFIHTGNLDKIYVDSTDKCSNAPCTSTRVLYIINESSLVVLKTISLGDETSNFRAFLATNPSTDSVYTDCCGNAVSVFSETNGTSTLTIKTQDANGSSVSGYDAILKQNGSTVASEVTTATFTVNNGENYTLQVDGSGSCGFDHWSDNGNTSNFRNVSISTNATLTAVIKCAVKTTTSSSTTTTTSTSTSSSSSSPTSSITTSTSVSSRFLLTNSTSADSSTNTSSSDGPTTNFTSTITTNSTLISTTSSVSNNGSQRGSSITTSISKAVTAAPIPNFVVYAVTGSIIAVIVLALGFAYFRERQKTASVY